MAKMAATSEAAAAAAGNVVAGGREVVTQGEAVAAVAVVAVGRRRAGLQRRATTQRSSRLASEVSERVGAERVLDQVRLPVLNYALHILMHLPHKQVQQSQQGSRRACNTVRCAARACMSRIRMGESP